MVKIFILLNINETQRTTYYNHFRFSSTITSKYNVNHPNTSRGNTDCSSVVTREISNVLSFYRETGKGIRGERLRPTSRRTPQPLLQDFSESLRSVGPETTPRPFGRKIKSGVICGSVREGPPKQRGRKILTWGRPEWVHPRLIEVRQPPSLGVRKLQTSVFRRQQRLLLDPDETPITGRDFHSRNPGPSLFSRKEESRDWGPPSSRVFPPTVRVLYVSTLFLFSYPIPRPSVPPQ